MNHLHMWKHLWDVFMSDTEFRKYYTTKKVFDLTMQNTEPITGKKGTLYIPPLKKNGSEGHFLAFEITGKNIHIFDGYAQFREILGLRESVSIRSKKIIKEFDNHPQDHCDGDTFCQTWSLAWLNNKLRLLTKAKNENESKDAIYKIVNHISHSKKFIDYMMSNEKTFDKSKLFTFARTKFKVSPKTCKINNTKEFIEFSQKISKQDIAVIMENK